ncbi:MAG: type II toxin-antitoxin system VapC family toxin [Methanomicrobiales archaeon]|jgi:predicted nucleic acid-binding protein|uniref:type II toxin-antitoxin system VapC family toxin n=1 Tax=Methanospirillum sp. TaxID=45200 RepID=UPI0016993DA5|nr:type II toxin-antitoxin system VapC family toxin [Methanospirillum sp.]NLL11151.1 type II toxin-antitoxin system VapC family toxin [Methanomicrobiales archaeon]
MHYQTINEISDNSRVIVDSNIFIYSALRHPKYHRSCYNLFTKIEEGHIRGYIPSIVIQEVLHRLMIAELQKISGEKDLQKIKNHIRKNPQLFKTLSICWTAVEQIFKMGFTVLGETADSIHKSILFSQKYSLFAKDSVILSIMDTYGIDTLVTNDNDFQSIPWLQIYKPDEYTTHSDS